MSLHGRPKGEYRSAQHEGTPMSLVMITHDLAVVAEVARRVCVMYAGQVVEQGPVDQIFETPRHPYTEALLAALPEHHRGTSRLATLPGIVPGRDDRPAGCLLAPRCAYVQPRCVAQRPALEGGVRCFFPRPAIVIDTSNSINNNTAAGTAAAAFNKASDA